MLSQQQGLSDADARSREPFLASMTGFLLLIALLYILKITYKPDLDHWVERAEERLSLIQQAAEEHGENWTKAEKDIEELDKKLADLKNKGEEGTDRVQRQLDEAVRKLADEKRPLFTDLREFRIAFDRWLKNDGQSRKDEGLPTQPRLPPPEAKPLGDALINAEVVLPSQDERLARTSLRSLEAAFSGIVVKGTEVRNDPRLGHLTPRTAKLSELSGPRSSRPVSGPAAEVRRDEQDQTYRPLLPSENTTYLGRSLFTDYLLAVELAGTLLLVATIGAIAIAQRRQDGLRPPAPANGTIPRRTA
jgi:hypothetical protein